MTIDTGPASAGEVKSKSPFEEICDKIALHNDWLSTATQRVHEAVNQIAGLQPPHPAEGDKPDSESESHFIGKINTRLGEQEVLIERLQSAVRRLSPLL